jgi:zinc transport system ATP-binding protein
MDAVISFTNVNFSYNHGPIILKDINLQVAAGEFIGIVGPNGGGKTTLLKLILGLLKPNLGTITVLKQRSELTRHLVGYVPQFSNFDRDFPISVEQVILSGRLGKTSLLGAYTRNDRKKISTILEQLEISHLLKYSIGDLSGGQLQRVLIARALACEPKILLLDEPTANTDIHAEKNIFDLLKIINQTVTILLVSHDIGFISHYIKRVACINTTLICHYTSTLTPKLITELYDLPIKAIGHHNHRDQDHD